jgi:hypothetical protein
MVRSYPAGADPYLSATKDLKPFEISNIECELRAAYPREKACVLMAASLVDHIAQLHPELSGKFDRIRAVGWWLYWIERTFEEIAYLPVKDRADCTTLDNLYEETAFYVGGRLLFDLRVRLQLSPEDLAQKAVLNRPPGADMLSICSGEYAAAVRRELRAGLGLQGCINRYLEIEPQSELETLGQRYAEAGLRVFAFKYFLRDFTETDFTQRGIEELLGLPWSSPKYQSHPSDAPPPRWDHAGAYEFEKAVKDDDEAYMRELFRVLFREPGRLPTNFKGGRLTQHSKPTSVRADILAVEAVWKARWREKDDDALGHIAGTTTNLSKQLLAEKERELKKRIAAKKTAQCSHKIIAVVDGKPVCRDCGEEVARAFRLFSATYLEKVTDLSAGELENIADAAADVGADKLSDSPEMKAYRSLSDKPQHVVDQEVLLIRIENILGPEAIEYGRLHYIENLSQKEIAARPGWDQRRVDRNRKKLSGLRHSVAFKEWLEDQSCIHHHRPKEGPLSLPVKQLDQADLEVRRPDSPSCSPTRRFL